MIFRKSNLEDNDSIYALHTESFGDVEGPVIAKLVQNILNAEKDHPTYSFVLEENNIILGHINFSPVTIEGHEEIKAFILAPLAISINHQRKGFGSKLIKQGIDKLKAQEVEVVFVLGDPNFYGRSGFKTECNVATPFKTEYPAEAWMSKELKSNVLANVNGAATCVPPLMEKKYW